MKRSVNRIKKIGLDHLIRKLVKLERRMDRILKEYYATQEAITYFQKEKNLKPEEINTQLLVARGGAAPVAETPCAEEITHGLP